MNFTHSKSAFWVHVGSHFRVEVGWFNDEPFALLKVKVCEYTKDINWFTFIGLQIVMFHISLDLSGN